MDQTFAVRYAAHIGSCYLCTHYESLLLMNNFQN